MADNAYGSAINPNGHWLPQQSQSARMTLDSVIDVELQNGALHENLPTEAGSFNLKFKPIHRFPSNLKRIGTERDYIAPRTVAIGPYYHGFPGLQLMEKVKRIAVNSFFEGGRAGSPEATYEKIKSVAYNAPRCYTDGDALQGITDEKFAEIMFVDGCFLVQVLNIICRNGGGPYLNSIMQPYLVSISRDMMLLENQIPWAVMEVLMPLKSLTMEDIIHALVHSNLNGTISDVGTEKLVLGIDKEYKPSHLLCLVHYYEAGSSSKTSFACSYVTSISTYTSAVELTEIGIKLKASQKRQFSDMNIISKGPLCAKIFLAAMSLDATVYCWLVNLAAFEMWTETFTDDCYVNSYLLILSQLMNREEDVRELRVKGIVHGISSDRQIHEFFDDLAPDLVPGMAYMRLIVGLEEYRQTWWVWIDIYRFVYKNATTIATVLPIVSVLVGIFKALLSLKQQPAH